MTELELMETVDAELPRVFDWEKILKTLEKEEFIDLPVIINKHAVIYNECIDETKRYYVYKTNNDYHVILTNDELAAVSWIKYKKYPDEFKDKYSDKEVIGYNLTYGFGKFIASSDPVEVSELFDYKENYYFEEIN